MQGETLPLLMALLILFSRSPGSSARPGASSRTPPKICRSERKLSPRVPAVFGSVSAGNTAAGGVCRLRTVKQRRYVGARSLRAYVPLRVFPSGSWSAGDTHLRRPPSLPRRNRSPPGRQNHRQKLLSHPARFPQCKESAKNIVL